MDNQIGLEDILTSVIKFFKCQFKTIASFMVLGFIISLVYHNMKKPYYETNAIALSGLSFFEAYDGPAEKLDSQSAIDFINSIADDFNRENFTELSHVLNLSTDVIAQVKSLEAEGLYKVDPENREIPLSKFTITLEVYDKNIIKNLEESLIYYFNNNHHIQSHYEAYQSRSQNVVLGIDDEIQSIREVRSSNLGTMDLSQISISNRGEQKSGSNQIIDLYELKEKYIKELELLKPIYFLKSFSVPDHPKSMFFSRVITILIISLLLGLIVAVFKYLSTKIEK